MTQAATMIDDARVRRLNGGKQAPGRYVLYWMQQSQRAVWNHAFEYAASRANEARVPLVVLFVLTDHYPEANLRHYRFMLEGIAETADSVVSRGAAFVLRIGDPRMVVTDLAADAVGCVFDCGYLATQRSWRGALAEAIECSVVQVESDVIVPVETTSTKEEYAASTIRRKIHRLLPRFLAPLQPVALEHDAAGIDLASERWDDLPALESRLDLDQSVEPVDWVHGGHHEATARLDRFIADLLPDYASRRNDPGNDNQSCMSPYLHFGQISPVEIAITVLADERAQDREAVRDGEFRPTALSESAAAYLEELIVRRELSMNFVWYNRHYDSIDSIPDWAKRTIDAHAEDVRPVLYRLEELETAATDDPYWNAAQTEMVGTGKMHGYMRMYWGKKIIEWSPSASEAYRRMIYLNNRYFLDGRDANGYTGIAWCFGKHDRPWGEREVFGTLRYMNSKGLERKFAIHDYVRRVGKQANPG